MAEGEDDLLGVFDILGDEDLDINECVVLVGSVEVVNTMGMAGFHPPVISCGEVAAGNGYRTKFVAGKPMLICSATEIGISPAGTQTERKNEYTKVYI